MLDLKKFLLAVGLTVSVIILAIMTVCLILVAPYFVLTIAIIALVIGITLGFYSLL